MKLKLYEKEITLPSDLNIEERMSLANALIKKYPNNFAITGFPSSDHKVKIRLDILGTYILNAVKNIRDDVLSRYKQKYRPLQEISVSNLSEGFSKHMSDKLYSVSA